MGLFRNRPNTPPPAPPRQNGQPPRPATPPNGPAANPAAPAPKNNQTSPSHPTAYTPPPEFRAVREQVQQFLVKEIKGANDVHDAEEIKRLVEPIFAKALIDANLVVSRVEREHMIGLIMADILGYGPIQPLLDRDDISEVMVNGPNQVYIELKGHLTLSDVKFIDTDHVLRIIERIVAPLGRRIDESSPMVDARLPDGSRVNAIIPPLALGGPTITIRKFKKDSLKVDDLIRFGSMTPEFAQFLKAAVISGLNIIISGGTGSGKTTLLNVLSSFILKMNAS